MAGCLQIQLALGATTGIVVANSGGKTTPWFQEWQEFRRNIDEKSNGAILLDYLIFGETGNAPSMEEALVSGRANIGGIGCQGIVAQIPELAIPLLPYLFQSDAEAEYVFERKLTPLFSQIMAQRGLVLLRWANFGWGDLYAREPVGFPYELAGRQVRTASDLVGPAFLTRLKAEPSEITLSDLAGSMQNEKVFAGIGSLLLYGRKVPPAYKYIVKTHHSFSCGVILANKTWFDGLTVADQEIIRASLLPSPVAWHAVELAEEQLYPLLAAGGDIVTDLTPEQHNAWAAAALPLYASLIQQAGGRSIEVYDAITAGKRSFLHENGY